MVKLYRRDEADWAEFGIPLAVAPPSSTADVANVLRAGGCSVGTSAGEHDRWVVPARPVQRLVATIGGNVATNVGGLCCVKDRVTRDYVLALEVVTAAGEVVRIGRRTAKGRGGLRPGRSRGRLQGHAGGGHGGDGPAAAVPLGPTRTVVGLLDTVAACGAAVARVTLAGWSRVCSS